MHRAATCDATCCATGAGIDTAARRAAAAAHHRADAHRAAAAARRTDAPHRGAAAARRAGARRAAAAAYHAAARTTCFSATCAIYVAIYTATHSTTACSSIHPAARLPTKPVRDGTWVISAPSSTAAASGATATAIAINTHRLCEVWMYHASKWGHDGKWRAVRFVLLKRVLYGGVMYKAVYVKSGKDIHV